MREAFHQIASAADILVGNEEDFQLCLGFTGPEAGGKDLAAKIMFITRFSPMTARPTKPMSAFFIVSSPLSLHTQCKNLRHHSPAGGLR